MPSAFLNPWMLLALAAVALPILIEWLFRRRRRQIELPTLRFLLRSRQQKKVRRQDRILLALRMIAIGLLVLAIARPLLTPAGEAGSRHVVLLMDATASMNQQVDVTTAFGLAQKKAAEVVRSLPEGDVVSLVLLGDGAETVLDREGDFQTAAARIEALRATCGAAPIAEGLARLEQCLAQAEGQRSEVYIFSDFQKYTWLGRSGQAAANAAALMELANRGPTLLVDVGGDPRFNYMLTELRPEDWLMSTGLPVRFRAEVAAWSPPADARATVTFLVDGVKKGVREVRPGEQPVAVTFEHRFTRPGEYLVEAVLEGDEHRVDNRRTCLCTVPESAQVLVLDESAAPLKSGNGDAANSASGAGLGGDSAYLVRALAPPTHPGMERVSPLTAKVVHPVQVDYENLEHYSAVVLTDAAALAESLAAKLENYVAEGGGLWLFLGPRANIYQYNKRLLGENGGRGLLPCRLITLSPAPDAPASGDPPALPFPRFGEATHPALAQLTGAGREDAALSHYMDLELQPGARVVLALSNGAPALVEKPFGRGRVLLSNFTAGTAWTHLAATPEFPILVQELVRHLAGNRDATVNLNVGDRFEQPVYVSAQHLLLKHPDGRRERLAPREHAGHRDSWVVRCDDTKQQGTYEFVDTPPEVVPRLRFVVNQKADEGDLSRLNEADFTAAFGRGAWRWAGPDAPLEQMVSRRGQGAELSPGILWALAAVLGIESLLAMRFGRRREKLET